MSDKADIFFVCYFGALAFLGGWWIAFCTRDRRQRRRATIAAPTNCGIKFCRDCKWAVPQRNGFWGTPDYEHAICMHQTSMRCVGDFLATGEHSPRNAYHCSVMRSVPSPGQCGPTGEHWQLRDKRTPKLITEA